jgi:translocation and assembly module TamB
MAAWRHDQGGRGGAPNPNDREQIGVVRPQYEPLNWRRGILVGVSIIAALLLLAVIAVWVVTGTDWGHERVRRYAQSALNGIIHGKATIGQLSGNLLTGMTAHNLVITDSAGRPFVAVESFTAKYDLVSLVRKHVWIRDAVIVRPLIVLDRPPNGQWNWQRIFKRDTMPKPPAQQPGWGDWIRFSNTTMENGQLIVRTPWNPNEQLHRAARDSAIRDVLGGGSRLMVQGVGGGFQKIVQLDSITASIPLLRLAEPGMANRLAEVSALSMVAFPFRPPAARVVDLKGVFPFNNDSVWWKGAYAALPHSKASGDGSYGLNTGDLRLVVHSDPANFGDMRWVYPRLPANGHGKLDLKLMWHGAVQDYAFTNTDITIGNARTTGSFGVTLADTITIHDTNVRFSGVDTRLLEQLIPHLKSPRRGVLAGRATVSGGRNALALNGDVTFDDSRAGRSRLVAVGEVGFPGRGMRARDLRVQMLPVQVDMARTWYPTLPISGVVTGAATVNGSTTTQLAVVGNVDLRDRGTQSVASGKATIRSGNAQWLDVDLTARPVSLVEVGRFFPAVGLQGSATGPVRLEGPLRDLRVRTDLVLPDGGRFATRGTVDVASKEKAYNLSASLFTFNLRTIDAKAPVTSLTAQFAVHGRGTQLATMHTTLAADLSTSRWDSIAADTMSVRASVAGGVAQVQRLYASGAHTAATVTGNFGLVRGRTGELTYKVAVDSLGAFNRWLPRTQPTSAAGAAPSAPAVVSPRPGVVARAVRQARADSARIARATEMERLISGRPGPKLVVAVPKPVPRDTMTGALIAAGKLSGNLFDFDLRGRAAGENIVIRGNSARLLQTEYAWTHARTPHSNLAVGVDAGGVSAMGFAFDTANVRVTYASPGGHAELVVTQAGNRQYAVKGDYALYPDRKELNLANMSFRFDTAYWSMPHESELRWGEPGLRVTNLELVNRGNGRIYANGLLPTSGVGDFTLDVDNFPVANIVDLAQTDVDLSGIVTLHGAMNGTLSNPAFRGAFGMIGGLYNETSVPDLRARFGYADRELVTHVDAVGGTGQSMATVDARLPIDLAMSNAPADRLPPRPASVDLVADSLPLELIPQFTDVIANFHGRAAGRVAMRGTLRRPTLVGALTLNRGSVTLVSTGAQFDDLNATVRMANDTVYVDSVAAWAKGPVRLRGTLAVGNWREPEFNLYLVSSGAQLMNNDRASVQVDAGLALTGPFRSAYASGAATITRGVIYAPEPTGRHMIGAGDPALFNVLDTAVATDRELFPAQSPLLSNLRVDVALGIKHDTWVRNREANVEVYTDQPVTIHDEQQALSLVGVVTTDRGEYNFLSKRFQIRRGSAMFVGSPDLNPTLQITGEYQVEVASRGALNIRVLIGGTLRRPKLTLESDAQPPRTQSELLSLLAFGQSTTSLLAFSSSSVAGNAATSDLFGAGAQLAVRRLEGVALGVAVEQLQQQAGRAFGTDVFDITPADVPTEIGGRGIGNFLTQTKIEAGKYVNPRTFLTVQEQAVRPGLAIEHRTADGWQFRASAEPRILLSEPKLNSQPYRTVPAYGGFIIREWRF